MESMRFGAGLLGVTVAVLASGCATPSPAPIGTVTYHAAERAQVLLSPLSGSNVSGQLEVHRFGPGVRVTGTLSGFGAAGEYGIHIAELGDCSDAYAQSSGAIFNPHRTAHGKPSQGDHMAGDMENVVANASGIARVDQQVVGVTLGGGAYNDIAGRAVVVSRGPDDHATQPDGGVRIRAACGAIEIVEPPPEVR